MRNGFCFKQNALSLSGHRIMEADERCGYRWI